MQTGNHFSQVSTFRCIAINAVQIGDGRRGFHALGRQLHQVGTRTDLHAGLQFLLTQLSRRIQEQNRIAHMLNPVLCILYILGCSFTGFAGNKANSGGFQFDLLDHLAEFIQHGLHHGRVERMRNGEQLGLDVFVAQ